MIVTDEICQLPTSGEPALTTTAVEPLAIIEPG
jgi:hypothetical protein